MLTLRREDHLEDGLGAIFFESAEGNEREILRRLGDYLGPRLTLIRAEVGAKQATVDVGAQCFSDESERLRIEAEKIWASGGRKAALNMIRDAIELDVLSASAAATLGRFMLEAGTQDEALKALRRARELGGDSADVLRMLAQACLAMNRKSSAVAYLRAAVELAPQDFQVLRMLDQLGYRKPRAEVAADNAVVEPGSASRHRRRS
jgi:tetratricopeptide (TPR) repeat protein